MRKLQLSMVIGMLFCMILLAGCNNELKTSNSDKDMTQYDWKKDGFVVTDTVEEKQEYWIQNYLKWEHDGISLDPESEEVFENGSSEIGVYNGNIYRLHTIICPPYAVATRWVLEIYNTIKMETQFVEFTYEQLGLQESKGGYLVDMDVLGEQNYTFQWMRLENYSESLKKYQRRTDVIIYSDLTGNIQQMQLPYDDTLQTPVITGECVSDAKGNIVAPLSA